MATRSLQRSARGDTALLVSAIHDLTISTHVNNHNLTVLVGWLLSHLPGTPAFLANLTSMVLGTAAAFVFFRTAQRTFTSRITQWVTTLALVVSHSMWWHSTTAEVYAANALLMCAAFYLLARYQEKGDDRSVFGLFAVSGLAFFNHIQLGIIGAAATWLMIARFAGRPREERSARAGLVWFLRCSAAFFVGFLPFFLTFVKDALATQSVRGTLRSATGGDFQSLMFTGTVLDGFRESGLLLLMQFPSPFLVAIICGLWFAWKRWGWRRSLPALVVMFVVNTWFFMHFNTWDRFAFLLPSFLVLVFASGFAVDALVSLVDAQSGRRRSLAGAALWVGAALSVALPPYFYAHLAGWAERGFLRERYGNQYSFHLYDQASYVTNPDRHAYREFDTFARELFRSLPPRSIIFDDDSRSYYQLGYFQRFEHLRPDVNVRMVNSWGCRRMG